MHNPMFLIETEVIIMLMNDIKEICHTSSALKAVKEAVTGRMKQPITNFLSRI